MRTAFLKLHLSILLAGFTGIFGKLIHLPEGPLVWYRLLFASVLLFGWLELTGARPRLPFREMARIGAVGALLAVHWVFFYGSIKHSNVSIGVICFSLTGFFTAFFDPVINGRRVSAHEVAYSLVAVAGIGLIFHLDVRHREGILLGTVAAALAALFTIFNKRVGRKHDAMTMLCYELPGGFLFLTLLAPPYLYRFPGAEAVPGAWDVLYLLLLASLCTIGLYLLQIQALQAVSPFTVNLSYNLEPVYSIVIAMAFFHEAAEVNASFYAGLGLICLSVALQTRRVLVRKRET